MALYKVLNILDAEHSKWVLMDATLPSSVYDDYNNGAGVQGHWFYS